MTTDRLVRHVFVALTAAFVVFIATASWTPVGDPGQAPKAFRGLEGPADLFRAHNLRDFVTNVLLYIPLGVLVALAIGRPRLFSPWFLTGSGLSLVMEVGQMFIGRHPGVIDLVTNSFGYVVGYSVVVVAMRTYGLDPTVLLGLRESDDDNRLRTIAALRFIYVSIYALVAILPLDVSVSLSEVYGQLFPRDDTGARIILDPLYSFAHWQDRGLKLSVEMLGLIPLAALTAFLDGMKRRLNLFSPVLATLLLAGLCETAQLFLLSRTSDIAMIPVAALAGLLGWMFVAVWLKVQETNGSVRPVGKARGKSLAVAWTGYAVVLLVFAWSPFRFETDPVAVAKKIVYESNLIPFKEHFGVRSLSSAVDIVKEFGQMIPFGLLAAALLIEIRPRLGRVRVLVATGIASGLFATFVELSQSASVGRYTDLTDVLLAAAGGVSGGVMLRLFRLRHETSESPP